MPWRTTSRALTLVRSVPPKRIRPPLRGTRPISALSVEVLPAPLAPMMPTAWPGATVKPIDRTAQTPP